MYSSTDQDSVALNFTCCQSLCFVFVISQKEVVSQGSVSDRHEEGKARNLIEASISVALTSGKRCETYLNLIIP